MRTLILPDCHLNWSMQEKIYQLELPDKVIHLGDIFDNFGDSPVTNAQAAHWFYKKLYDKKWIFVKGNHDLMYHSPFKTVTCCSGFAGEKFEAINSILSPVDWDRQKWYHILGNILFTHAGLSNQWCGGLDSIRWIKKYINISINYAERDLILNQPNWLYNAGRRRGGNFPVGGILWCDVNEFKPTEGIVQIFGHTPDGPQFVGEGGKRYIEDGETFDLSRGGNFMLDSETGTWYGVIEDRVLTVRKYDLINS